MGLLRHRSGHAQDAIPYYNEALRLDPTHEGSVNNLAVAAVELGHAEDAFQLYEVAIAAAPEGQTSLRLQYADLLAKLGRVISADRVATMALAVAPDDADAQAAVARLGALAAAQQHRVTAAQTAVGAAVRAADWGGVLAATRALEEPVEEASWYLFSAGMAHFFNGEHETALQLCAKAAMHTQDSHLIWGCAGVSAQRLERHEHAMHFFEKALETMNENEAAGEAVAPASGGAAAIPRLGFSLSRADIEHALLGTALNAGEVTTCLHHTSAVLGVPPITPTGGGAAMLLLSFVDWTADGAHAGSGRSLDLLSSVEVRLRAAGQLTLPKTVSMEQALRSVQQTPRLQSLLNNGYACLLAATDFATVEARALASAVLVEVTAVGSDAAADTPTAVPPVGQGIVMLSTYSKGGAGNNNDNNNNNNIDDELSTAALLANLRNPFIERIVLLNR